LDLDFPFFPFWLRIFKFQLQEEEEEEEEKKGNEGENYFENFEIFFFFFSFFLSSSSSTSSSCSPSFTAVADPPRTHGHSKPFPSFLAQVLRKTRGIA